MNFRAGGDQDDGQHCNVIGIIINASCSFQIHVSYCCKTDESMNSTQLNFVSECQANHEYVCIEAPCFKGKKA